MLNYKDYQLVRNNVWKLIIDAQIKALPVSVSDLCKKLGITLRYYQPKDENDGMSFIVSRKPIILINKNCSPERKRFTAAHELGHIILGHVGKYPLVNREPSPNDNEIETQANMFAARLLSPACVLWACNVHNSKQIQELCNISKQAADWRMERMNILYDRNKFLSHPLERQVFNQFHDFIKNNKY